MLRCVIVVSMLVFGATASEVADYFAMGIGTKTCGEFAKDYAASPTRSEDIYFAWAQGFMTGLNLGKSDPTYSNMGAKTVESQEYAIRQYCDQHPLADFMSAIVDLYKTLPVQNSNPK